MSDRGLSSLPSAPGQTPGLPENFTQFVMEGFNDGLNTKPSRPAIKDTELAWLDGWMPYGNSRLQTLYGAGPDVYDVASGNVTWFGFGNIGDTRYGIVLNGDGSLVAFNTDTGGALSIWPQATIVSPSTFFGFSQWGSEWLIFCKDQPNGYWLWDGVNLFTAGTVGPEIDIIDGGSHYSSPPTLTVRTTGVGTGAAYTAQIQNQSVVKVTATAPGSGFFLTDRIAIDTSGGGSDDQAVPMLPGIASDSGGLDTIFIIDGGSRFSSATYVNVTGGGGSGASVSLSIQNGTIVGAAVVKTGTGYTSVPTLQLIDPNGTGQNGDIRATIAFGQITSIGMIYGGSGYDAPPIVVIDGDGTGATAVALIESGIVTSIQVTANGKGYSVAIVRLEGGNNAANVRPTLMPFGISGTAVEVYQQRVWVTNGSAVADFPPKNRTIFSSVDSAVDFGGSGGAFQSRDSFLRVGYHWLRQSNGFLYLGADSSINYVSGVTTSTTGTSTAVSQTTTTFGNQNVDPQLGSPWPSSVQVFSRNIVFANTLGIFVSYGGAVQKASEQLDGFYGLGPIFDPGSNFSSAVANIFNVPIYMLLLPTLDLRTRQNINKLLMWDGKRWFTSQQDRPLTYIATQEINSVMTAWGTDGISIFRLFQQASTGFDKSVISKLYSSPAIWMQKTARALHGVAITDGSLNTLDVTIDNETATGTDNAAVSVTLQSGGFIWSGLTWNIIWGGPGFDVFGPYPIGQQGRMIGMSLVTSAGNASLLSLTVTGQNYTANV